MDGFEAYKLYFALKLHFSSPKYDVFTTRGAVNGLTFEKFKQKKESKWFNFLATKFQSKTEFVQFVVACVAFGNISDVFDLQTAFEHHAHWIKNKQMSSRIILDDLDTIEDLPSLLVGCPAPIIQKVIAGKVNLETAVAIQRIKPFLHQDLFEQDYLIFSREALKIKKMDKFVKFDETKVNPQILSKFPLNTESGKHSD